MQLYYRRTATQVEEVRVWSVSPAWIGIRYRNATGAEERIFVAPAELYRACLTVIAPRTWQPGPAVAAGNRIVPGPPAGRRGQRYYQVLTNDPAALQALLAGDPALTFPAPPSPDTASSF
jgi:hypothetical protein